MHALLLGGVAAPIGGAISSQLVNAGIELPDVAGLAGDVDTEALLGSAQEVAGGALADGFDFAISQSGDVWVPLACGAVGALIVEAIAKGRFRATIGKDAATMDKLSRLNPKYATELIAKQMGDLLG